jgi:hypothetical protein
MIDPIAVGLTKEYVSVQDVVVEEKDGKKIMSKNPNPTVWLVGAIDSIQKAQIQASWFDVETTLDGKSKIVRNKDKFTNSDFEIVKFGLKGFRNFGDTEFKTDKIKFFDREVDIVSEETVRRIPLSIIQELAKVIWDENQVNEELRKN